MKKILLTSFIVALGLLGASCKDDNSTAGGGGEILPDQQVSCEIFMPTDGATKRVGDYSPKSWFEKDAGGNSQYHCGY